jgi:hypothetical protein
VVEFWRIERNRGSQRTPKWVWVASSRYRKDAEQCMFRSFIGLQMRVVANDDSVQIFVPFGPLAPGEVDPDPD